MQESVHQQQIIEWWKYCTWKFLEVLVRKVQKRKNIENIYITREKI